jgi:hypothetical protein
MTALDHGHECRGCGASVPCVAAERDCRFDGYCDLCDLDADWPNDPPEPAEPRAWQRYDAHTDADGSVQVWCETNDNLDRGYPSEYAAWELAYPDRRAFLRGVGGGSRQGIGCQVTVTLDGRELDWRGEPVERRSGPGRRASDQGAGS